MPFSKAFLQAARSSIAQIEELCAKDVGRNTTALSNYTKGNLYNAALSIASHPQPSLGILTGFYIPTALPQACETDGPLGTALLARGLAASNIPVRVVTDSFSSRAVQAALDVECLKGCQLSNRKECDIPLDVVNKELVPTVASLLEEWKQRDQGGEGNRGITHVISVERAGPARDGHTYNMRGKDIGNWNADLDRLFIGGHWKTIGIGDGGNELGMGSIPFDVVKENIQNGDQIACAVPCDHLIVCGVSNWGAWGLTAALAVLRQDWHEALMMWFEKEWSLTCLRECVEKGPAVDGVSGRQTLSVDGLDWNYHTDVLENIRQIASQPILGINP